MSAKLKSGNKPVEASERKLKVIYDCLDYGDYKKAIQEADRLLKKSSNFLCAKALKALAMVNIGRKIEAEALMNELKQAQPVEDNTLSAMVACYKELQDLYTIIEIYKAACNKISPPNVELMTQLFMAYVRVDDFHNQQQVALKLYKLTPTTMQHLFWAVISNYFLAGFDPTTGAKIYLPLAEQMMQKCLKEEKMSAEPEFRLFAMILEKRGKYKELIEFLDGPHGNKVSQDPTYRMKIKVRAFIRLERWKELNITYKKLFLNNLDSYALYKDYIMYAIKFVNMKNDPPVTAATASATATTIASTTTVLSSMPSSLSSSSSSSTASKEENTTESTLSDDNVIFQADDTIDSISLFLLHCMKTAQGTKVKLRGPFLGQLKFLHTLSLEDKNSTYGAMFLKGLIEYCNAFSHKPSCFKDCKQFFEALDEEQIQQLLEATKILKDEDFQNLEYPKNLDDMQRHLFYLQSFIYCRRCEIMSLEEKLKFVSRIMLYYEHGQQFGEGLKNTDIHPADLYLLLVVLLSFDLHKLTNDLVFIVRSVIAMERSLLRSPSNHLIKLLLVQHYALLGDTTKCIKLCHTMDIKHIQLDTLGYLVSNSVMKFGHLQLALSFHESVVTFFLSSPNELINYMLSSYKWGAYDKIPELLKMKCKLVYSLQHVSSVINKLFLDLYRLNVDYHSILPYVQSNNLLKLSFCNVKCGEIVDNRDFNVMPQWSLFSRDVGELQMKSFNEERIWLYIQSNILKFIWFAVTTSNNLIKGKLAVYLNKQTDPASDSSSEALNTSTAAAMASASTETTANETVIHNVKRFIEDDEDNNFDVYKPPAPVNSTIIDFNYLLIMDMGDSDMERFKSNCEHVCASVLADEDNNNLLNKEDYFFSTPLKYFFKRNLHISYNQCIELFFNIINAINDPELDASIKVYDIAWELAIFDAIKSRDEVLTLTWHVNQLLVILACCGQLLLPLRQQKKPKKKSKIPEVPNALKCFDTMMYAVMAVHAHLQTYYQELNVCFDMDLEGIVRQFETADQVSIRKIVMSSNTHNLMCRNKMQQLLNAQNPYINSFRNLEYNPDIVTGVPRTEELIEKLKAFNLK